MTITVQEAERLVREGVAALQQGRPAEARRHLQTVTATGRANVQIWLMLATACRDVGDAAGEEAALDQVMAMDPKVVRAIIMKGDCRARAGDRGGAISAYKLAVKAAAGQNLPEALAAELRRAETVAAGLCDEFEAEIVQLMDRNGLAPGERSARFRQSIDIHTGRKDIFFQEPTYYFFPGLPQVQFFETAGLEWVRAIEAKTDVIRNELQTALLEGINDFRPYMHSGLHAGLNVNARLIDSYDWSALFLMENGQGFDHLIERFPQTWEAVQAAPLPWIKGAFPTVMFSLLKPGAHIAPHTGMINTRLTCHLPLIVPPNCSFRVGNEVRDWEEGKLIVFDDTIEHEAWNRGEEDRVVLIFDVWRPELDEQERQEVTALLGIERS
jgi:aspartyl/asparaginyl beta-hydroxylase (cupin superfamily)